MPQNYEVFLADKPLLICREDVDKSRFSELDAVAPSVDAQEILYRIQHAECNGLVMLVPDPQVAWTEFCDQFTVLHAAGGAVSDPQGRLLGIHRMGRWDLPKGKLEKGEDARTAAVREVEEECGLSDIAIGDHLISTWHVYEHRERLILKHTEWYAMEVNDGQSLTPQTEEYIDEVRWLDDEGVKLLLDDTYRSMVRVVEQWRLSRPTP